MSLNYRMSFVKKQHSIILRLTQVRKKGLDFHFL